MTDDLEIDLTKGQSGYKGLSSCSYCNKFIEEPEDSVRIGIDYHYEWVHLYCFIEMIKSVLEKAEYSANPSKRNLSIKKEK